MLLHERAPRAKSLKSRVLESNILLDDVEIVSSRLTRSLRQSIERALAEKNLKPLHEWLCDALASPFVAIRIKLGTGDG
jgi:hypothetical protein